MWKKHFTGSEKYSWEIHVLQLSGALEPAVKADLTGQVENQSRNRNSIFRASTLFEIVRETIKYEIPSTIARLATRVRIHFLWKQLPKMIYLSPQSRPRKQFTSQSYFVRFFIQFLQVLSAGWLLKIRWHHNTFCQGLHFKCRLFHVSLQKPVEGHILQHCIFIWNAMR